MGPRFRGDDRNADRVRTPIHFSNSPSRSRGAFLRPGLHHCFAHPDRGVGGAPRNVRVLARHPLGLHMTRQARRLRGALRPIARQDARERAYDAGRSPLGAPPWRFWAPGAALLSPALAPDRLQRAPRTQVVVPGGRGPEPPEANDYEPPPQDATPRSAFRIVSRTRPQRARLRIHLAQAHYVVKKNIQNVVETRRQPAGPLPHWRGIAEDTNDRGISR
jgi:hypothetical protein